MRHVRIGVLFMAVAALSGAPEPSADAVAKGIRWLVSAQGSDGGWGQDGGGSSTVRANERVATMGNDVANTAVAALALVRNGHTPAAGEHRAAVRRAVEFVLRSIEESPEEGLAVTRVTGTQIQGKLGPFIDTFFSSMLLSDLDGQAGDAALNARVRQGLEKCIRKIQRNQQADGSWNISGGWAPILGTSIASQSLFRAQAKGVRVDASVLDKVKEYTKNTPAGAPASTAASAGVELYANAQVLEQLSRTSADRVRNEREIRAIGGRLDDARFVRGFGSMGGEEFFSYLNISDSLQRTGGEEWKRWNSRIKETLVKLQNNDGTWAGHHCITGRVAVTSAAVLTIAVERHSTARKPS